MFKTDQDRNDKNIAKLAQLLKVTDHAEVHRGQLIMAICLKEKINRWTQFYVLEISPMQPSVTLLNELNNAI